MLAPTEAATGAPVICHAPAAVVAKMIGHKVGVLRLPGGSLSSHALRRDEPDGGGFRSESSGSQSVFRSVAAGATEASNGAAGRRRCGVTEASNGAAELRSRMGAAGRARLLGVIGSSPAVPQQRSRETPGPAGRECRSPRQISAAAPVGQRCSRSTAGSSCP